MIPFLWGALAAMAATVALFFLKFARQTKDRLFGFFAAAFAVLAVDWFLLAALEVRQESRHLLFLLRLLAFLLIITGIIDKNRSPRR
jgi:zinc transporter ZupT